jgi:hypothetical protein
MGERQQSGDRARPTSSSKVDGGSRLVSDVLRTRGVRHGCLNSKRG